MVMRKNNNNIMEEIINEFLDGYLKDKDKVTKVNILGRKGNKNYLLSTLKRNGIKFDKDYIILKKKRIKWLDCLDFKTSTTRTTHASYISVAFSIIIIISHQSEHQGIYAKKIKGSTSTYALDSIHAFFNYMKSNAQKRKNTLIKLKMIEYDGVLLNENDYKVLKSLEKKYNKQIPSLNEVNNLDLPPFGYRSVKGEIIYLNLVDPSLKENISTLNEFPNEILKLKSLQELYLSSMQRFSQKIKEMIKNLEDKGVVVQHK